VTDDQGRRVDPAALFHPWPASKRGWTRHRAELGKPTAECVIDGAERDARTVAAEVERW